MTKKGRKRNVLIIGEAPDEDEATQTVEKSRPLRREARDTGSVDDETDVVLTRPPPRQPTYDDGATDPVQTNPLLQAREVRVDPLHDAEEDETAPINKDALRRARDLPPEATWPPENRQPPAVHEAPVILRGTVRPGRTSAFAMEGTPRVRPLGAVEPLDFEAAPEAPVEDPRVLKGTVIPGRTASFFLGNEGRPTPAAPREPEASCWRLHVHAPEGAAVFIDGVSCGAGPVTIEGEAVGLSLVVEVQLPGGRSWAARQPIDGLITYELFPA